MKTVILIAMLVALVPGAVALDPVCVSAVDTCASAGSWSYGDPGCDPAAEYSDEGSGVFVDSGIHHLSVRNWCYAYNWEGYSESGSGVGVNYYSYDENTGTYSAFGAQWYSYDWTGGSFCEVTVYSYGMEPFPNGGNPAPCTNGGPGRIIPALP